LGIALLSPLASNSVLPSAPDFGNHTAIIVQTKMAFSEGQFPLFVAPWQFNGWRYPFFQFYSPSPYILAALIYKWVTPNNPYLALKLILWMSLVIAGIFIYKSTFRLTRGHIAAFLSGVVYMAAPYFLININVRGAFTEAVAQGILPIVLYLNLRMAVSAKLRYVLLSAIAWYALATTHIITFIYFALFLGMFFFFIGIRKRMRWIKFGLAFSSGCVLGLYFLIPVASVNYLQIDTSLAAFNPYTTNWLTPIETLLSPVSISPIPLPLPDGGTSNLNPAVGWPILLAVGFIGYELLDQTLRFHKLRLHRLIVPLMCLFGVALFMTWSPVDFWKCLPRQFWVIQFTYRLLAQVDWIGSILFAYALVFLFGIKIDIGKVIIGLLLILNSLSSYLPTPQSSSVKVADLVKRPDIGYGRDAYLTSSFFYPSASVYGNIELPVVFDDSWLILNSELHLEPALITPASLLHLEGNIAPELSNGTILSVLNDGKLFARKKLPPGPFVWDIPLQNLSGLNPVALKFMADPTFTRPGEQEKLAIDVHSLTFQNLDPKFSVLPVKDTEPGCSQKGYETICRVLTSADVQYVQLPLLFYPNLLEVWVDGVRTPYIPLVYRQYLLTGVSVSPGSHTILFDFVGVSWARWVSIVVWIIVLIFLLLDYLFVVNIKKPFQWL